MARTPKVVEDRREQIIDAAMHVFAQKGFSRATNKDIAREAGITPGLIYHYFESKEALLKAIIEGRSPLRLIRTLPPQVMELPPETFLRFMAQQMLAIVEDEQFVQLLRVFLPEILHNPAMSPLGASVLQQGVGFLQSYFASHVANGTLRTVDTALTAQIFAGSLIGFVLRRQILRDPSVLQYTHEQIANAIVDTTLKGVFPR